MRVLVNGLPKSGSHAALKAVQLLGVGNSFLDHWPKGAAGIPEYDRMIHIIRDPRDALVSWARMSHGEANPGYVMSAMDKFVEEPFYPQAMAFYDWMDDKSVLTIRLEDLRGDDGRTIEIIADFLGVPYWEGAVARLPGLTRTYNEVPSDYRDHWNDLVEAKWLSIGGPELLERSGYEDRSAS